MLHDANIHFICSGRLRKKLTVELLKKRKWFLPFLIVFLQIYSSSAQSLISSGLKNARNDLCVVLIILLRLRLAPKRYFTARRFTRKESGNRQKGKHKVSQYKNHIS
jgi:hypothetical protein